MANVTRRLHNYAPYQYTAIRRRLERMAAEGWRLEKIGLLWRYRRAEPAQVHYAVAYFADASQYDPGPTPGQETFQEFCAEAGWKLAAQSGQMLVFENEQPDPLPLDTDEALRLRGIRRAMRGSLLPSSLAMVVVCLMQLGLLASNIRYDPIGYLSQSQTLWRGLLWVLLLASFVLQLTDYGLWVLRSKRSVAAGGPCAEAGQGVLYWLANLCVAAGLAGVVGMLLGQLRAGLGMVVLLSLCYTAVLMSAGVLARGWMKRRGAPRGTTRLVTIGVIVAAAVVGTTLLTWGVIRMTDRGLFDESRPVDTLTIPHGEGSFTFDLYADELPLRVEDLTAVDYDHYSYEAQWNESPLYRRLQAWQRSFPDGNDAPDLSYELLEVKWGWLQDWTVEQLLKGYEKYNTADWNRVMVPIDPTPWHADRAWELHINGEPAGRYLLCWPGRVAALTPDSLMLPLTQPQREVIAAKLGG